SDGPTNRNECSRRQLRNSGKRGKWDRHLHFPSLDWRMPMEFRASAAMHCRCSTNCKRCPSEATYRLLMSPLFTWGFESTKRHLNGLKKHTRSDPGGSFT